MSAKCFVLGCRSGWDSVRRRYKRENKKHPQMFGAPKHWTMLQIWSHVIIPKSDKSFSITDKICELHFTDDYLSRYHELTLYDGQEVKLERNYIKLLPGAIPTIFSDFPQYSKSVQKIVDEMHKEFPLHIPEMDIKLDENMQSYLTKILEVQKKFISKSDEGLLYEVQKSISDENIDAGETFYSDDELDTEEQNEDNMHFNMNSEDSNISAENVNSENDHIEADEDSENEVQEESDKEAEKQSEKESEEITFDMLVKNVNSISKPNSSWSVTTHGIFVMCAKWNKQYQPEKRVVIDRNLNIKVFLKDNEIAAYKNCISDIADISNILNILDK